MRRGCEGRETPWAPLRTPRRPRRATWHSGRSTGRAIARPSRRSIEPAARRRLCLGSVAGREREARSGGGGGSASGGSEPLKARNVRPGATLDELKDRDELVPMEIGGGGGKKPSTASAKPEDCPLACCFPGVRNSTADLTDSDVLLELGVIASVVVLVTMIPILY